MERTILGLVLVAGLTVPAPGQTIVVALNGVGDFTEISVLVKRGEYVIH